MKRLMFVVAAAAMFFAVGCSKESKMESYMREAGEIMEVSKDEMEKDIKKELESFRKMSAEEQDKALEDAKKLLEGLKEMKKKGGDLKSKLGL